MNIFIMHYMHNASSKVLPYILTIRSGQNLFVFHQMPFLSAPTDPVCYWQGWKEICRKVSCHCKILLHPLIKLFLILTRCDLISQAINSQLHKSHSEKMHAQHSHSSVLWTLFVTIINDQECKLSLINTKNTL